MRELIISCSITFLVIFLLEMTFLIDHMNRGNSKPNNQTLFMNLISIPLAATAIAAYIVYS